jgi:hypothetical protein
MVAARRATRTLAALALLALAGPLRAAEAPDHADTDHVYIRISDGRVNPKTARLKTSEALAFVNYSSRAARVSFPLEVAKGLRCKSRGSFGITGERLVSGKIEGSGLASLCQLAPGTYEYKVELYTGYGPVGENIDRTLDATLIVE